MIYTLTHLDKPWSLNQERTEHWRTHGKRTKEWRETFWALAKEQKIKPQLRIGIVATQLVKNNAGWMDLGNYYGSVKAAVDGLVDADVIVDDNPTHVMYLLFSPPEKAASNGMRLVVDTEPANLFSSLSWWPSL